MSLNKMDMKLLSLLVCFASLYIICSTYAVEKQNLSEQLQSQGYEIKFDYQGYRKERAIAYEYYKQNYSFDAWHPLNKSEIGIDLYDLNNDGEKEIITYLQNDGYCGSAGCRFHILKKIVHSENKVQYDSIAAGQIYPSISVLDSKTYEYCNLRVDDKSGTYIWSWNGIAYRVVKEIQTSDYDYK